MERGVDQGAVRQARPFVCGQRLRGEAFAAEHLRDGRGSETVLEPQHADDEAAWALVGHDPGGGGAPAQGVVDEAGDGGPVARSGEAMGEAPILQGVGGGAAARGDIGEDLDGGGEAGGGRQGKILGF
jgi:hypothetical protein